MFNAGARSSAVPGFYGLKGHFTFTVVMCLMLETLGGRSAVFSCGVIWGH